MVALSSALRAGEAPRPGAEYDGAYLKVGFDQLASYVFTPPQYDPAGTAESVSAGDVQIPAPIKALSGKKVVITGYMVPVRLEKGMVTEFLLMRNTQACCFGGVPNMNEWVVVKIPKGVPPLMDTPVAFYGLLKVGSILENGYVTGLYELDADRMGEAKQ
jgi:hypothetical protein